MSAGARVRRVLLLAGLVFAALPAGSALAKTIGQTGGNVSCPAESAYGDTNYVAPSGGGTITSFSFQSGSSNAGGQLVFLVLRPAGSGSYTVVGKTGLVTLAGTGLETFPANISVRAGDILGFWPKGQNGLGNCAREVSSGGGYIQSAFTTNPKVGETLTFPLTASFFDLNESATVYRHPFAVYAGYADSFRDGRPNAPSPWRGSPGVIFNGCNYFTPSRCPTGARRYDAGALRLDNRTSQPLTVTTASVTVGSCTFKPWPGLHVTEPGGKKLVLTQTGGKPPCNTTGGRYNFDSSDTNKSSTRCTKNDGKIPVFHVTVNGRALTYRDTRQILNKGGKDPGAYRCGHQNETHDWAPLTGP